MEIFTVFLKLRIANLGRGNGGSEGFPSAPLIFKLPRLVAVVHAVLAFSSDDSELLRHAAASAAKAERPFCPIVLLELLQ